MPTFIGNLTLSPQQNATFEEQSAALIAKHTIPEVVVPNSLHIPSASDIHPTALGPARTKKIVTDLALVLENAAYGFVKPNILDVKLGVRLWADDAAQEKKDRFDKVTQETTHKDLGFRIAGMRVWQGHEAMNKPSVRINHTTTTTSDGYKIYDKNFGRDIAKTSNILQSFSEFIFVESAGIDEELGKLILEAFIADVESIQDVMEREESRMYSGSLLFVFEGDGKALRKAMEEVTAKAKDLPSPPTTANGSNEDEDDNYDDDDSDELTSPKIYSVKVIDFAHAEWTPGQGPDENSIKGIRSVVKIMKDLHRGGKDFS